MGPGNRAAFFPFWTQSILSTGCLLYVTLSSGAWQSHGGAAHLKQVISFSEGLWLSLAEDPSKDGG